MKKNNYKISFQSKSISKTLLNNLEIYKAKRPNNVYIPLYKEGKTLDSIFEVGDKIKNGDVVAKDEKDNLYISSPVSGEIKSITESQMIDGDYAFVIELETNKNTEILSPLNKLDKKLMIKQAQITGNHDILRIDSKDNVYIDTRTNKHNFGLNEAIFSEYKDKILEGLALIQKCRSIEAPIVLFTDKINEFKLIDHISKLGIKNIQVSTGRPNKKKKKIVLSECLNYYEAIKEGKIASTTFLFLSGNSIAKPGFYKISLFTGIDDLIEIGGGLKNHYEDIDKFKEDAAILMNEEMVIKQEIKKENDSVNQLKLIKMLKEKREYARDNIYNNLEKFQKKYLLCLRNIVFSYGKTCKEANSTDNSVDKNTQGIFFISNGEKSAKSFSILD